MALEAPDPCSSIVDLTDIAEVPITKGFVVAPDEDGTEPIKLENLTDYEMLVYYYADGRELEVYHPVSLSVRFDGAEQITCADRVGIVAPPSYLKCERFPKFGKPCFAGHDPVHRIGSA